MESFLCLIFAGGNQEWLDNINKIIFRSSRNSFTYKNICKCVKKPVLTKHGQQKKSNSWENSNKNILYTIIKNIDSI